MSYYLIDYEFDNRGYPPTIMPLLPICYKDYAVVEADNEEGAKEKVYKVWENPLGRRLVLILSVKRVSFMGAIIKTSLRKLKQSCSFMNNLGDFGFTAGRGLL